MIIYNEADWRIDAKETGHCQACYLKPGMFMVEEDAGFCPDCNRWYCGTVTHKGGKIRIRDGRPHRGGLEDLPETFEDE